MLVYRWENEYGTGPFCDGSLGISPKGLPTPWKDNELPFKPGYHICACETLNQLDHWFDSLDKRAMEDNGYKLKTYAVPESEVHKGDYQVIFPKKWTNLQSIAQRLEKV